MLPLLDMQWVTAASGEPGFTAELFNNLTLSGAPVDTLRRKPECDPVERPPVSRVNRQSFRPALTAAFTAPEAATPSG